RRAEDLVLAQQVCQCDAAQALPRLEQKIPAGYEARFRVVWISHGLLVQINKLVEVENDRTKVVQRGQIAGLLARCLMKILLLRQKRHVLAKLRLRGFAAERDAPGCFHLSRRIVASRLSHTFRKMLRLDQNKLVVHQRERLSG